MDKDFEVGTEDEESTILLSGFDRKKIIHIERQPILKVGLKVVLLLLSLLVFIDSTILIFWGYYSPEAFITGLIVWGYLGIPILIAAYLFWAKMVTNSIRISYIVVTLIKAVTAYVALSFLISVISTCVVTVWQGPKYNLDPEYVEIYDPTRIKWKLRVNTYFAASLVQIGYILVTACCHRFSITHRLLIETAAFLIATFLMALTVAASTSGDPQRETGRALLTLFFFFEMIIALAYQLIRILDLYPTSSYNPPTKITKGRTQTKNVRGRNLKKARKMFTSWTKQSGEGHETESPFNSLPNTLSLLDPHV